LSSMCVHAGRRPAVSRQSSAVLRTPESEMKVFIVLYRIESVMSPCDAPFGFRCHADDTDHAEEQCLNAYPDCDVVWIHDTDSYENALESYYKTEE
jgi:hypothetical protein